ncbi:MAG: hypothetical protein LUG27_04405, partial [Clostridiales bacterium]|nr:hypothetical protein [Clostridiales bacterium]
SSGSTDYSSVLGSIYEMLSAVELVAEDIFDRLTYVETYLALINDTVDILAPIYDYMVDFYEILPNINNYVVELYNEVCALPEAIADLFAEYFMDTYYVSQTVFEIIRGDLDMIYELLKGDIFNMLAFIENDLAQIGAGDVEVDLSGVNGHLSAIEVLLTGIAAILAVDTLTDLADFADDQLDEYLDDITDSLSEVGDAMTDVFPFCIPWDMLTIFALFAAAPEAPVFEIPFEFDRLGISYTMKVDFSEYEQAALICRTILTCIFVVGLGYLTIRITNGGGGGGEED